MELYFTETIPGALYSKSGIYVIKSHLPKYKNKVLYVGSSLHIGLRWSKHRNELRKDKHSNNYLQNHYSKHGESLLYFSLIEELPLVSVETLHERETYWIKELSPVMNLKTEVTKCGGIPQHWVVCSPEGEWSLVHNLTRFAALNDLKLRTLVLIAHGRNRRKSHKGWFVRLATYTEIQKGKVLNKIKSPRAIDLFPYLGVKGVSTDKKEYFQVSSIGNCTCRKFNRPQLAVEYLKECLHTIIYEDYGSVTSKVLASSLASLSYHFLIIEDSYARAWDHCLSLIDDLVIRGYLNDKESLINLTNVYLRKLVDNPKYKPYHNNIYGNLDTSVQYQSLPVETRITEAVAYMKQIGATLSVINLSKASGINYECLTSEWSHYYKPLLKDS
jgi:hypothetical protein